MAKVTQRRAAQQATEDNTQQTQSADLDVKTVLTHPGAATIKAADLARAVKDHAGTVEHTVEQIDEDPSNIVLENAIGKADKSTGAIGELEREIYLKKAHKTTEMIPFKELYREGNVRTPSVLKLPEMVQSFKDRGYKTQHPVVLSKKGPHKYLVLCGHRRVEGLELIHKSEPNVFKLILPDGKIPAIVLEDLTEREEIILRNDHSAAEDRVGLGEEGTFLSIRQFLKGGWADSQSDIARKLGLFVQDTTTKEWVPNRSYVQQRVNLARMPEEIQTEYLKLMRAKDEGTNSKAVTNVRWSQVARLFKIYLEERREGHVKGMGPKLKEAFEQIKNKQTAPKSSENTDGPKAMTPAQLEKASENLSSRFGQLMLMIAAGQTPKDTETQTPLDLQKVDERIHQAEEALTLLQEIKAYMGKTKYDHMIQDILKKRQKAAS